MIDLKNLEQCALDILAFDGDVRDTLAEFRRAWGQRVPALLGERFEAVSLQYMPLPHEQGVQALGQELTAWGWGLYNFDDGDEYAFVLIPETEHNAFEAQCRREGHYCKQMKQPRLKWGDHAKEQDPGQLMPCEQYVLSSEEHQYFFNSLSGDFAAGEWKRGSDEKWRGGCVADLRRRPPQVTRDTSLTNFGGICYSSETGLYAAASARGTTGKVLVNRNPANLNWFEPSPVGYDGPPQTLVWWGNTLWVGDAGNVTQIEMTERGTRKNVRNWELPKDDWCMVPHPYLIVPDGMGRVYFSNEWRDGKIYKWENGHVTEHPFHLDGYDHLSEAVPVPGTGHIYIIHAVGGKGRLTENLLELDMDTGRCRIAALPGMGEGLSLRWFAGNWLLIQGNGEVLSDDFAQLVNISTREVLRIRPQMLGGEKLQHIGLTTDGAVVLVTRRNGVGQIFRYPTDFWKFLRAANKPKKLEPWREYQNRYPDIPFALPELRKQCPESEALLIALNQKMAGEPILQFYNFNFKLAIMQVLMYEKGLLEPKFDIFDFAYAYKGREIDPEYEGYDDVIPEAAEWFWNYPIPARLAQEVTEINMDGGDDINCQLAPQWDGEDDLFSLNGLEEAEVRQFPNLKRASIFTSNERDVVPVLRKCGVEAVNAYDVPFEMDQERA